MVADFGDRFFKETIEYLRRFQQLFAIDSFGYSAKKMNSLVLVAGGRGVPQSEIWC